MKMEEVRDLINQYYEFEKNEVKIIKALDNGWDNNNYLVQARDNLYVFREYLITPKEQVKQEIDLVKVLNKLSFPTYTITRTRDNALLAGADNESYVLYKYIECSSAAQPEHLEQIVEAAHRLHVLTYGYNVEAERNRYKNIEIRFMDFVDKNNFQGIQNMQGLVSFLKKWMNEEKKVILDNDSAVKKTWAHHDLNPDNILVGNDEQLYLIDFDECLYGSFLIDICSIFHYWCLKEDGTDFDLELAQRILKKYNELTPLTEKELELLPYYLVQYQLEDTLFYIMRELQEDEESISDVTQSYSYNGLKLLYGLFCERKLLFEV